MSNPCKIKQDKIENRLSDAEVKIKQLESDHREAKAEIDSTIKKLLTVTSENTSALHSLIEETRGIAKLWRDLQGVYSFTKVVQDVLKWVAIVGGVVSITYHNYDWIRQTLGF